MTHPKDDDTLLTDKDIEHEIDIEEIIRNSPTVIDDDPEEDGRLKQEIEDEIEHPTTSDSIN